MAIAARRGVPGRPVLAWLAGCGAAALTVLWATGVAELAGGDRSAGGFLLHLAGRLPTALGFAALALFLTSVPLPLLVWLARINRWRRGQADVALGGLLGAGLVQLFGLPVLDGPAGWAMTALAGIAGLMGGLVYWLTAGMPGSPRH